MVHVRNCQTTLSKHFHVALQGKLYLPMVFWNIQYILYIFWIYSVLSLCTSLRHFFLLRFSFIRKYRQAGILLISGTQHSMTGIDYIRAEQGSLAKGVLIMIKEPVNVRTFESTHTITTSQFSTLLSKFLCGCHKLFAAYIKFVIHLNIQLNIKKERGILT